MFLARFAAVEERPIDRFGADALEAIRTAEWPGNVRQLENTIHRAVVLAESAVIRRADLRGLGPVAETARDIPDEAAAPAPAAPRAADDPFLGPDGHVRPLAEVERAAIENALARYGGRMTEVARRLGIGRSTLYRKLDEYRPGGG